MPNKQKYLDKQRLRRSYRVRKKVRGTPARPRLSVCRSLKHMSCQVIDDIEGRTLAFASTKEKDVRGQSPYGGNQTAAELIGKLIAERSLAAGVKEVRFDRGATKYHGRVAALAGAAREAGLVF